MTTHPRPNAKTPTSALQVGLAQTYRRERTNTLGQITRLKNAIKDAMKDQDEKEVKAKIQELPTLLENYRHAHVKRLATRVEARPKEDENFADNEDAILGFIDRIYSWLNQRTTQQLVDDDEKEEDERQHRTREWVENHERYSNSALSTTSKKSRTSIASQLSQGKAELASLLVEQARAREMMELVKHQQELDERLKLLKLQTKIDTTKARHAALAEWNTRSDAVSEQCLNSNNPMMYATHASPLLNVKSPDCPPMSSRPFPNLYAPSFTPPFAINANPLCPPPAVAPLSVPVDLDPTSRTCDAIITALSMPQPELTPFSGDYLEFPSFIGSFDFRVGNRALSGRDKLHYLREYLRGEPREVISGCFHMPENGYTEARRLLDEMYGNEYNLALEYMQRLSAWPQIKGNQAEGLRALSCFIARALNAMTGVRYVGKLNHPETLRAIVSKLPGYLQNRWCVKAHNIVQINGDIGLSDLAKFIKQASDVANDPMFSRSARIASSESTMPALQKGATSNKVSNTQGSNAFKVSGAVESCAVEAERPQGQSACVLCNRHGHSVQACKEFLKQSVSDRKNVIREKGLCYSCLGQGHMSRTCRKRMQCDICSRKHPTLLHWEADTKSKDNKDSMSVKADAVSNAVSVTCGSVECESSVFHSILPVMVKQKGSNQAVLTYCFLDNGSNGCFITQELFDQLQLTGRDSWLRMNTMHGASSEPCVVVHDLIVCDTKGGNAVQLPKVYTKPTIPMSEGHIARRELCGRVPELNEFKHLLPNSLPSASVGILIGCNCALIEPLQVANSQTSSLHAVMYRHGWTVQGATGPNANNDVACNRIVMRETVKEVMVPQELSKLLELDFNDHAMYPDERGYSVEDKKFLKLVNDGIKFVDGHYEVPLPLRDRSLKLPNNRAQAMSRLLWQSKKMERDSTYKEHYAVFMNSLIEKGYCEEVPLDSKQDAWYLPHHGVYNPHKQGKVRVVFDCSAKHAGVSLNDLLLQGPDLTNNLWGVLTRFRFGSVAFAADLEAMFYQVRVPENDRRYLRFLWWQDGLLRGKIIELQMTVHIFGAASSPSVANYVIKEIARCSESEEVSDTLSNNFYVDDCLRSVSNIEDCENLINDIVTTFKAKGFRLTKFISNDRTVLNRIDVSERAKEVGSLNLDLDELPITRALGVLWDTEGDNFGFRVDLKEQPMTRRGVLSITSALYDPLGFVALVVMPAKRILQRLCSEGVGWDECLSTEDRDAWENWVSTLHVLREVKIPRCFLPLGGDRERSLHVFGDASASGYGAVAYLRCINFQGEVNLSFVAGKARVSPLKVQTIPKLELTAATLAVRLACLTLREMRTNEKSLPVTYHTDSEIVLHCIRNEKKRFPVFFANRLQLIREFSSSDQWRYVPSKLNPADDASRGLEATEVKTAVWLKGPAFLLKAETEWPEQKALENLSMGVDASVTDTSIKDIDDSTARLIQYFSSWKKLCRAVAIYRRLPAALKGQAQTDNVNAGELDHAARAIVRWAQRQSFSQEIDLLKSNRPIRKSSPLRRLCPFLDDDDILCVGGRLRRTRLEASVKHPMLLPRKSRVTELIIQEQHVSAGHAGRNFVLSMVREQYWVIKGNAAVRQVLTSCVKCKRGRGRLCEPQMADLPSCRGDDSMPPFTFVGIDYFGPLQVKFGRKSVKRYGVLFTCLVSRAIHLEVAAALDTSSFINAFRRFVARRGTVTEIYSDNGTNFVGAHGEFQRGFDELERSKVNKWAANCRINWHFNPPKASHMGGAWERAIGTVRKVLFGVLQETGFRLDDETLHTLMCEVENIVNSRPLTTVSSDSNDLQPLTPNQILCLKAKVLMPPPGVYEEADVYSRRRWRRVQQLAQVFWCRWRKEFLSQIQNRAKWSDQTRNLRIGDVVIIKSESPRNEWPLGRVDAVENGNDGVVRAVTLTTQSGPLRRPAHGCVLLVPNT